MDIGQVIAVFAVLTTLIVGFVTLGWQHNSMTRKLAEDKGRQEEKTEANESELRRHDKKCSKRYKQIFNRLGKLEEGQARILAKLEAK